jgi:ERF superfamily
MQRSEQISELVTALSKAQSKITGARKDQENSFFSSKYADLASCWDACREALTENGLSVVQSPKRGNPVTIKWETTNEKTGEVTAYSVDTEELVIVTTLFHSSGQWLESELPMIPRDASPQGYITAITYGRRGGLCPMVGIAQIDDDGNSASGRTNGHAIKPPGKVVELGKDVPLDKARSTAMAMLAIIDKPAVDGDHDENLKAKDALDYHDKVLVRDEDLYVAAGKQLSVAKKNVWSALVRKAREAEKLDKASDPTRARTF